MSGAHMESHRMVLPPPTNTGVDPKRYELLQSSACPSRGRRHMRVGERMNNRRCVSCGNIMKTALDLRLGSALIQICEVQRYPFPRLKGLRLRADWGTSRKLQRSCSE